MKFVRLLACCLLLSALASAHYVDVKWAPSATLGVTYSVFRSTTSGAGYVRRAANLKVLHWRDNYVIHGRTYYYVVRAVKQQVQSANSPQARATIP